METKTIIALRVGIDTFPLGKQKTMSWLMLVVIPNKQYLDGIRNAEYIFGKICRTVRFSETPAIISILENEGVFDDRRSAGDPSEAARS